jgi:hypothetical protein
MARKNIQSSQHRRSNIFDNMILYITKKTLENKAEIGMLAEMQILGPLIYFLTILFYYTTCDFVREGGVRPSPDSENTNHSI